MNEDLMRERLMKARTDGGFSRKALSEKLNIPYRTLTNYENGYRIPGHAYIVEIAEMFGVTTDYIYGLSDSPKREKEPVPPDTLEIAEAYSSLDAHGKAVVDSVLKCEKERIEKERAKAEIVPITRKTIPLLHDVAAGPTDVFGEIMDEYEIDADSPANFAIQISGDSMEPFLPDGSVQLGIMGNGLETGDIGVFMLDGGLLCKQYVKDNYGNVYLNSLNRDRADADVTLMASGNQTVFCYGKVLTNEKIPVQM